MLFSESKTGLGKPDIKDTPKENTHSNKSQAFTKSINMKIWVIDTLNYLFKKDSYTQIKSSKKNLKKSSSWWQTSVRCNRSILNTLFDLS